MERDGDWKREGNGEWRGQGMEGRWEMSWKMEG